jgi:hypothetical protein
MNPFRVIFGLAGSGDAQNRESGQACARRRSGDAGNRVGKQKWRRWLEKYDLFRQNPSVVTVIFVRL